MADEKAGGRFLGRNAGRTLVKLVVASVIVGAALSLLGLSPFAFWRSVIDGVRNLVAAIGDSFGEIVVNLATYLLLGAVVVVPIWLLARLVSSRRGR